MLLVSAAVTFGPFAIQRAQAKDFVVNTVGDEADKIPGNGDCDVGTTFPPSCTLRAAIQEANALGGAHTISFNLGSGNPVITPGSGLPFITTPLIIDGATGGATRVQISGVFAGNAYGLVVGTGSDGSRVSSLVIRNFSIDGLVVASNVTVENCYIGTDANGAAAQGNGNDGIRVDGANNVIGGTSAGTGNVISGNSHGGVHVILSASGNQIEGNRIGLNAAGTAAIGNGSYGVYLDCTSGNSITNNTVGGTSAGARNVISANGSAGVYLKGAGANGNHIEGNYIGTDINGTTALGNGFDGVRLENGPDGNFIGVAGGGNVISGNKARGIWFLGATNNTVRGNFIGTDASGTKPLGNNQHGIWLDGVSKTISNNLIGGSSAGAANVISANGGNGVYISLAGAHDNSVQGNFIGTDVTSTTQLGNGLAGVFIASNNNTVGGGAGLGNIIAFNVDRGVSITGVGNAVSMNSIFSNGLLGIDLNNDGATANDTGDADTGPNNLQNFPIITAAAYDTSSNATTVQGTLNSTASTSFTIEFFSSAVADPSGNGEGQTFRGSTQVATDGSGNASFSVTLNAPVPGGQIVTATATDPANNTSEFSQAVAVTGPTATATPSPTPTATPTATPTPTPPSQLLNLSTRKQVGSGDNVLIGGFIVAGSSDKQVLLRGLGPSLPVVGALQDPTLELHRADTTLLAINDNWQDTQATEINATGIPPSSDLESAIIASLAAEPASKGGAGYTGVLAGKAGTTGIGLLEIYDLAITADSKLANISTRGFVGTGDDLLIGGFIPGPSDRLPLKVLVRALGPSLTAQGVSGALQDPLLELHDANGTLVTNDNWRDAANAPEIEATLPPPDDRESAIIMALAPTDSGYTAVVRGTNNSTGVALVEVYALR